MRGVVDGMERKDTQAEWMKLSSSLQVSNAWVMRSCGKSRLKLQLKSSTFTNFRHPNSHLFLKAADQPPVGQGDFFESHIPDVAGSSKWPSSKNTGSWATHEFFHELAGRAKLAMDIANLVRLVSIYPFET